MTRKITSFAAAVAVILASAPIAVGGGFALSGPHASQRMRVWVAHSHEPLPPVKVRVGFGNPLSPWGSDAIYLPSCCSLGWTHHTIRGLLFHELGHVFDRTMMRPALRAEFRKIVGVPVGWNWWAKTPVEKSEESGAGYTLLPGTVETKISPGEMFAEEYAACSLGLTQWQYQLAGYNTYGWLPLPGTDSSLCALIHSAGEKI